MIAAGADGQWEAEMSAQQAHSQHSTRSRDDDDETNQARQRGDHDDQAGAQPTMVVHETLEQDVLSFLHVREKENTWMYRRVSIGQVNPRAPSQHNARIRALLAYVTSYVYRRQ